MRTEFLVASLVCVAACGDESPGPAQGVTDPSAARSAVDAFRLLSTAISSMSGPDAVSGLGKLQQGARSLVQPTDTGSATASRSSPPEETGTVTCDPDSCTFDNYGTREPYTVTSLSGRIARSDDTYTLDLTTSGSYHFHSVHWSISGTVLATATLLDGDIHLVGDSVRRTSGPGAAWAWELDLSYLAVELDAQGCPIGSSVRVISRYDFQSSSGAGGIPADHDFYVKGTVTFGPACGDAR